MSEALLEIKDLSVTFGSGPQAVRAVRGISFDLAKGETLALVGESGSGKSVTALSVLQLLPYPLARHDKASSVKLRDRCEIERSHARASSSSDSGSV